MVFTFKDGLRVVSVGIIAKVTCNIQQDMKGSYQIWRFLRQKSIDTRYISLKGIGAERKEVNT